MKYNESFCWYFTAFLLTDLAVAKSVSKNFWKSVKNNDEVRPTAISSVSSFLWNV